MEGIQARKGVPTKFTTLIATWCPLNNLVVTPHRFCVWSNDCYAKVRGTNSLVQTPTVNN